VLFTSPPLEGNVHYLTMNSESILQIAESTDPFRTAGNLGLERTSARDLDEQRANGKKLTLWKEADRRHRSNDDQEEQLMANSHAASLTSSTITQLTDS
jgi:hypothetical protein